MFHTTHDFSLLLGDGTARLVAIPSPPPTPPASDDPLEQLGVGAAGRGDYAGYSLGIVETFDEAISALLLHGDQLAAGGTPGSLYNNFSERDRRRPFSAQTYCLVDPWFAGWKNANDGVALSSFADTLVTEGGVIRSRHRHATAQETAILGARTNERGPSELTIECVTAHPTFYGRWAFRGPCIVEYRLRVVPPAGYTIPTGNPAGTLTDGINLHAATWRCNVIGGSEAQNPDLGGGRRQGGEHDDFEISLDNATNTRPSGNGAGSLSTGYAGFKCDGTWQIVRLTHGAAGAPTKMGLRLLQDDLATPVAGSSVLSLDYDLDGSMGSDGGALEDLQYYMFGTLNEDQNSRYPGVLDHTKWIGKSMDTELSSMRVWIPSGNKVVAPVGAAFQINRVPYAATGTVVVTIPSAAEIWGSGTWTEVLRWMHAIDVNGPGRTDDYTSPVAGRTTNPTGLAQNLGTRQITLTMSSFAANKPGVVVGHLWATDATTGISKPYRIFIAVAPRVSIPAIPLAAAGAAYSHTIPRDDGAGTRYWDAGNIPKLGAADGGLAITQKPAWLVATGRALSGTAPATLDDVTDTVTASVENAAGDVTTQVLDLVWTPRTLANRVYALDPRDPAPIPGNAGDAVEFLNGKFAAAGTLYLRRATAGERPVLKANGGVGGASRVFDFNGKVISGDDSLPTATFNDFMDASNASTGAARYLAMGFKGGATLTNQRLIQWCISSLARNFQVLSNASGVLQLTYTAQGAASVTLQLMAALDANWHVLEVLRSGSTLNAWIDGTQVITHTITETGSMDMNLFRFGGSHASGVPTPGWSGELSRLLLVSGAPGSDQASIRSWIGRGHQQAL